MLGYFCVCNYIDVPSMATQCVWGFSLNVKKQKTTKKHTLKVFLNSDNVTKRSAPRQGWTKNEAFFSLFGFVCELRGESNYLWCRPWTRLQYLFVWLLRAFLKADFTFSLCCFSAAYSHLYSTLNPKVWMWTKTHTKKQTHFFWVSILK